MADRLLVTGGSGQVGSACARLAAAQGYEVVEPSRAALNLADAKSIRAAVAGGNWTAVVNCGAFTAVDQAESEPNLAHKINAEAPRILARETSLLGIPLIHVSTDYVFDGRKNTAYVEDDPIQPLNVYGRSKAEGERAVREENPRHAIIRTSWVVSAEGGNFAKTMVSLAATRLEVRVVDDQVGCPTGAEDLASALLAVTRAGRSGTWHFANKGEASWCDVAAFIFARLESLGRSVPRLTPIPSDEYPTPAARPRNSRLETARFAADFAFEPRPWQQAVGEIVNRLCANGEAARA